jgi:hypothetical protein
MNKDILAFKGFIESRYQITLENDEFLNKYLPVFKHEFESWQSACEYKDKELIEWREAARSEGDEVNRLQAENKKLREALEFYANCTRLTLDVKDLPIDPIIGAPRFSSMSIMDNGDRAQEALKETKE